MEKTHANFEVLLLQISDEQNLEGFNIAYTEKGLTSSLKIISVEVVAIQKAASW